MEKKLDRIMIQAICECTKLALSMMVTATTDKLVGVIVHADERTGAGALASDIPGGDCAVGDDEGGDTNGVGGEAGG